MHILPNIPGRRIMFKCQDCNETIETMDDAIFHIFENRSHIILAEDGEITIKIKVGDNE